MAAVSLALAGAAWARNDGAAGLVHALADSSGAAILPMPIHRPAAAPSLAVAANTATDIVQLAPPIASPFIWSATKAADGSISFAGFVPNQDVRLTLTDAVGKIGADTTAVASGAPDGFAARAVAAIDLLADLDSGKVAFDGASWSVAGNVDSVAKGSVASTAFAASPLKDAGATYQVDVPTASAATAPAASATQATPAVAAAATVAAASTPAAAAPAATVAPSAAATAPAATAAPTPAAVASTGYAWSATKPDDGSVTFAGSVPDAGLKAFLARHVAGKLTDNSAIAANAPAAYLSDVLLGLKALDALKSGKLDFADGKWTLTGTADDTTKTSAKAALAQVDPKIWNIEIAAPATAAATPAAAAAPASPAVASTPATAPAVTPTPAATPAATAPAVTTPPAPSYSFAASKPASGPLSLTGDVPNDVVKDNLASIAGNASTDALKIVANPPDNFINGAVGGLDALGKLASGQLTFDGGKWSLKGSAPTPDLHDSIIASIGDLPGGKTWSLDIAGPPPVIVCRLKLADAVEAGAVNFDTKTHFAKGTDATLDSIATILALCPDERVDVEGFTDTDGEAGANMALSVARAEAVVDALVKRGVKPSRLYAVGYGETLPLVPNTTKGNKAKNRRIDFKVGDGPQ